MKRRSRNNLHTQEMLYRPALEFRSALILILFSVYVLIDSWTSKYGISEIPFYCSLGLIAMACWRVWHGVPVFRAHWRLFHRTMDFLSLEDFRLINNAHFFADERKYQKLVSLQDEGGAPAKKPFKQLLRGNKKVEIPQRTTFLCNGFKWGPEHSERTYQVHNLSSDLHEVQLPFVLNPVTRHYRKLATELGGNYAIFGVDKKVPIFVNEDNFFGHTLITGNVGTGKTVLQRLLSSSMLHLGHIVLIVDPKNDYQWKEGLQDECDSLGKPFLHFHVGAPSKSVSYDVSSNYVKDTDLSSRIMSIISGTDGKNDPFVNIAEGLVTTAIGALKLGGKKPTLQNIYYAIRSWQGLLVTTRNALRGFYAYHLGTDWHLTVQTSPNLSIADEMKELQSYFHNNYFEDNSPKLMHGMDTVLECFKYIAGDESHYYKITASLMPMLKRLSQSPMDILLSANDVENPERVIVNSHGLFNSGGVLYISLDGLSDPKTARDLSQLITSDIAAEAGSRYNTASDLSTAPRVSMFIDEAHQAINMQMINLLAQGRAAKIALFISTQTVSDFVSETSADTASRLTGLCNNFISTRVTDAKTQELVLTKVGQTNVSMNQVTYTTSAGTKQSHTDFNGSISERKSTTLVSSIPQELLSMIPTLHFIACLQDGRKIVGQMPITVPGKSMRRSTTVFDMVTTSPYKLKMSRNLNVEEILSKSQKVG
ncbi:conjugative transfer system coupling protein TraD [Klebsiella pneumoniae]|nr:conjugative transfer system coupling protein TraD [Klebsiella pneumoniae]MBZ7248733.1 conjugative transfer system coupling protein TraD [Klebsiella pneumoniae]